MTRIFEGRRVWSLDQERCDGACVALAGAAKRRFMPFDTVLAVARGGCRPAEVVARELGVSTVIVEARHNPSDAVRSRARGRVELTMPELVGLPEQPRLLVVDDICGSGATLEAILGMFRSQVPVASLRTAVLCRNAGSRFRPDLWVWDVSDWVVFPWEPAPGEPVEPLPDPGSVRYGR